MASFSLVSSLSGSTARPLVPFLYWLITYSHTRQDLTENVSRLQSWSTWTAGCMHGRGRAAFCRGALRRTPNPSSPRAATSWRSKTCRRTGTTSVRKGAPGGRFFFFFFDRPINWVEVWVIFCSSDFDPVSLFLETCFSDPSSKISFLCWWTQFPFNLHFEIFQRLKLCCSINYFNISVLHWLKPIVWLTLKCFSFRRCQFRGHLTHVNTHAASHLSLDRDRVLVIWDSSRNLTGCKNSRKSPVSTEVEGRDSS